MRKLGVILVLSVLVLLVFCSVGVEAVKAVELGGTTACSDPIGTPTTTPDGDPYWDDKD